MLIEGVREEGLNLANLYIPGLSRYHIEKLLHAGYNNGHCLEELSKEDLSKILPDALAKRIKNNFPPLLSSPSQNGELVTENCKLKTDNLSPILSSYPSSNSQLAPRTLQPPSSNPQLETCNLFYYSFLLSFF